MTHPHYCSIPFRRWCMILVLLLIAVVGSSRSMPLGGGGNHNINNHNNNNSNNNNASRRRNRRRNNNNNNNVDITTNGNGGGGVGGGGGSDDEDILSVLQVSCRDEWYQVEHVSTMADVLEQLPRRTSHSPSSSSSSSTTAPTKLTAKDLVNAKLLYRGKVLEHGSDKLKQAGIQEGDTIFCVTENYRFRAHEALAIFLETMARDEPRNNNNNNKSTTSPLAKLISQWQEHGGADVFQWWISSLPVLNRDQIANHIRSAVDLGYHRLRMYWERPSFRQAMRNPDLEAYRKVLCQHLPKSIQQELSPSTRQLLDSPQAWRTQLLKVTEGCLRWGDLALDSLLDIVLDVVQGAGQRSTNGNHPPGSSASSLSSQFAASRASTSSQQQQQQHDPYEPNMEDPSMANQMLFELSESEDD